MDTKFNSKPTVTSVIAGGRRRLNYTFEDKSELVEEYDMKTHELLMRKIRNASQFKEAQWVYEIGEQPQQTEQQTAIQASNQNPIFIRKDTQQHFQFRIRNLPYPQEVYIIEVDKDKQEIIIKTTIKKYYKRQTKEEEFSIFQILNTGSEESECLTLIRANKMGSQEQYTVTICKLLYPKPEQILQREEQIREQFQKFNSKNPKEGEIECVHQ